MSEAELVSPDINSLIRTIRKRRVILDTDLARIYGVSIKTFNQAVKRNRKRFPEDFLFQLTGDEFTALRSQFVTLKKGQDRSDAALRPQFATLKAGRGQHRKYAPYAFTEHGALQAANILNSDRAQAMSVYVIRAFIRMREEFSANQEVAKRLAEIDKTLLTHDAALRDLYHKIRPLLLPPPEKPKRKIGFHSA